MGRGFGRGMGGLGDMAKLMKDMQKMQQGMLDAHISSSPRQRYTAWWISVSWRRQSSADACTPVISSSWDSLKSVVTVSCVSAEPSAVGRGVNASEASFGSARRLSFSTPRRIPASRAGSRASSRFNQSLKTAPRSLWARKLTELREPRSIWALCGMC